MTKSSKTILGIFIIGVICVFSVAAQEEIPELFNPYEPIQPITAPVTAPVQPVPAPLPVQPAAAPVTAPVHPTAQPLPAQPAVQPMAQPLPAQPAVQPTAQPIPAQPAVQPMAQPLPAQPAVTPTAAPTAALATVSNARRDMYIRFLTDRRMYIETDEAGDLKFSVPGSRGEYYLILNDDAQFFHIYTGFSLKDMSLDEGYRIVNSFNRRFYATKISVNERVINGEEKLVISISTELLIDNPNNYELIFDRAISLISHANNMFQAYLIQLAQP